ncbi:MAG: NUDIX domain-containing protein [Erysipelotrichales bacterium]|nr:NUDIX domain-containing protein [Erysipelotrichales bacterium]
MVGKLRNMTAIYLFKGDKVLLLFRQGGKVVNEVWTGSAGGHFEEYELNDAKECVLRELNEELSLNENDIDNLSLRYITLRRTKGEIRQNYYFFADLEESVHDDLQSNEGELKWFSIEDIGALEMPYTAKYVMSHYVSDGQFTDKLYTGVANENGVDFIELAES